MSAAVAESRAANAAATIPAGGRRRHRPLSDEPASPLLPVREGWLLRRVEGHETWNLVPAPYRRRALCLTILPLVLLDLMCALLGGPTVLSFVAFLVTWRGARPLAEALMRRAMARTPRRRSLVGRARGEVVRLRGRVRPGPSFVSAGGRWAAVLAAYAGEVRRPPPRRGRRRAKGAARQPGRRPWSEVRGIDFVVDLEGGGSLVVCARQAYMLAPAKGMVHLGSCRTEDVVTAPLGRVFRKDEDGTAIELVLAEWVIAPGDEVEVYGVLDFEVNASAAACGTSARTGGLSPVIKGTAEVPLVVSPI